MSEATPSQRIKALHRKNHKDMSLKDYAVELGANGNVTEKQLVDAWFNGKARRPEKQEAPKKVLAVVESLKKTPNKKR